jgi:hypothetical protein
MGLLSNTELTDLVAPKYFNDFLAVFSFFGSFKFVVA